MVLISMHELFLQDAVVVIKSDDRKVSNILSNLWFKFELSFLYEEKALCLFLLTHVSSLHRYVTGSKAPSTTRQKKQRIVLDAFALV